MGWFGRGTAVDSGALQLLEVLPADLLERGWTLVVAESGMLQSADGPRYRAVYSRPFDPALETEQGTAPAYDKHTRQQIVRVSTWGDQSPSWLDAREDAIRRMREADAKRRRKR